MTFAHRPYLDGLVTLQRHKKPVVLSHDEIPYQVVSSSWAFEDIINRRLNPSLFCDSVSILDDVDGKSGHHFHKFTRNLCKDQRIPMVVGSSISTITRHWFQDGDTCIISFMLMQVCVRNCHRQASCSGCA